MESKRSGGTWTIFWGVVACVVVWVVFAPMYAGHRPASPNTVCLSHLKQIGTAGQLYLSDNEDRQPLENWVDSTLDYSKNSDVYSCPLVQTEPKLYGYAMNSQVVGVDSTKVVDPSKTIVHFDTDAIYRNVVANLAAMSYSRHKNYCTVVRMDSSAKRIRDPSLPAQP